MTEPGDGEARLALDEPDLRLPWLESADDEDFDEGLDWSRIGRFAGFCAGALLILSAAGYYAMHRLSAPPEGDGSIIAAPETPYKVRPEDPGGKTFAGSGDTSYMIGEGIARDARLAPAPGTASPTASSPSGEQPEPADTRIAVQVGAYSTGEAAAAGWQTLIARYPALGDFDRRVVEARADIGTVFRLQALTADRLAAHRLCGELRGAGIECQVKR